MRGLLAAFFGALLFCFLSRVVTPQKLYILRNGFRDGDGSFVLLLPSGSMAGPMPVSSFSWSEGVRGHLLVGRLLRVEGEGGERGVSRVLGRLPSTKEDTSGSSLSSYPSVAPATAVEPGAGRLFPIVTVLDVEEVMFGYSEACEKEAKP